MAKSHRLKEVEKERGQPLEQIIPPLVNIGGQRHAADQLGLSQATISNWLRDNGYRPIIQYVKIEKESA
jgi:hypothetical protein